jgi:glycogen operon protein
MKYGSNVENGQTSFKVFAPHAKKVELCLFNNDKEQRLEMIPDNGNWSIVLDGDKTGQVYAYHVDSKRTMLDPYGKDLSSTVIWDYEKYKVNDLIAKSVVADPAEFDWQGVKKPHVLEKDSITYEVHVKGFSKLNQAVPKEIRGTYAGFADEASIAHLKKLGVTSVQLLPVFASMSETRLEDLGLSNYWGYNPISFFAPEKKLSASNDAITEFKTMVRELHRAGIEVILDVVYNHTAEGGKGGPDISFRGLNNNIYLMEADGEHYTNYTGCGNSVNMDDEHTFNLVIDSMRYWVEEMQVDGFRFDLATTVGRENRMFNPNGRFFQTIKSDPILNKAKMIAEPWDLETFQLGNFPNGWGETNGQYRDHVRQYWRGNKEMLGQFSTRIMGSQDKFNLAHRGAFGSINMITCHDGYTLHDLVTYKERHNLANKEDNRDGNTSNYSDNYGVEGETEDLSINVFRNRMKRNLMGTLLISQGGVHILGGDEICRTQKGNNNAYCQDNEISWFDWDMTQERKDMFNFTKQMIELRKKYPMLSTSHKNARWFSADAQDMHFNHWTDPHSKAFMVRFKDDSGKRLLILFNASSNAVNFNMNKYIGKYKLIFDTSRNKGIISEEHDDMTLDTYLLENHSMAMFEVDGFENIHN